MVSVQDYGIQYRVSSDIYDTRISYPVCWPRSSTARVSYNLGSIRYQHSEHGVEISYNLGDSEEA